MYAQYLKMCSMQNKVVILVLLPCLCFCDHKIMLKPNFVCIMRNYLTQIIMRTRSPSVMNFHTKPLLDKRTNVSPKDLCHMTKMATMPIYGINTSNTVSITSGLFNQLHCNRVQVCSNAN